MTRKFTSRGEDLPRIDSEAVRDFFEVRAAKVGKLGYKRAVIYQDKNQQLAERRDAAEKQLLLPLMNLRQTDRVLDAGCGTGRWAEEIVPRCSHYHGVDISSGLIDVARERFAEFNNAMFSISALDVISLEQLREEKPFSRVVSLGVLIYMNEKEVLSTLSAFERVCSRNARILLREPIALDRRLTLDNHYSEDMDQNYSAIYRTEPELIEMFEETLLASFNMVASGDVYQEPGLNNRAETKQRYYVFDR